MHIEELIKQLTTKSDFEEGFVSHTIEQAKRPQFCPYPEELATETITIFRKRGINTLFTHQYEAVQYLLQGKHVAISTGTASGKSLCYQIAMVNQLLQKKASCSLLLFPTKALGHDQKNQLQRFLTTLYEETKLSVHCGVFDGDTKTDERRRLKAYGQIIFTNPDMLHVGILPHHTEWARFFRNLQYIVIDETHIYRGVFGSHFANLIRRIKRICHFYGSFPQFILCSATLSNVEEFTERLIEEPVQIVKQDESVQGEKHFLIYNPPFVNRELGIRRGYIQETIRLLRILLQSPYQVLLFARSRRNVEMIYAYLERREVNLEGIRTYRSGYLSETRRDTENEMRQGNLQAVLATNALELGIDIGSIDVVVLCGYPGTIAATRQQAGRAGRRNQASLTILITSADPLEQYMASHPEYLLGKNPEQALIEPDNPYIVLPHLSSAAFELPFRTEETFGNLPSEQLNFWLSVLQRQNKIKLSQDQYYWIANKYPAEETNLRITNNSQYVLLNKGKIIGRLDADSAMWLTHPGAVYLHEGIIYLVTDLDLEKHQVLLEENDPGYYTEHMSKTDIELIAVHKQEENEIGTIYYGQLKVTKILTAYKKVHWQTREILDYGQLSLPPSTLITTGYWFGIDAKIIEKVKDAGFWNNERNKYGSEWRELILTVKERDHYTCQSCGVTEGVQTLEIHHKIPFKQFTEKKIANKLDNLVTLCPRCHRQAETMVYVQSSLSGLSYLLHNLAPLYLMCERSDIGIHTEAAAPYADQQPTVLFYDSVQGGIGLSEKLYYLHESLLNEAKQTIDLCPCQDGCPSCTGAISENGSGAKENVMLLLQCWKENYE